MCGNRDAVAVRLEMQEESRVCRGRVGPFDRFGLGHELFELGDRQPGQFSAFLFGEWFVGRLFGIRAFV